MSNFYYPIPKINPTDKLTFLDFSNEWEMHYQALPDHEIYHIKRPQKGVNLRYRACILDRDNPDKFKTLGYTDELADAIAICEKHYRDLLSSMSISNNSC